MARTGDTSFHQVARKIDPQASLLRTWALAGGVSAQVTALELERADGSTQKLIVRRHGEVDRADNPNIAADELRLLQILLSAGLPVPAPYFVDQSGEIFDIPYIVLEYVEGETQFAPVDLADLIHQMAVHLPRIHQIDGSAYDLSFLPRQEAMYAETFRARPARVDESIDEGRIRGTLESVWPLPRRNKPVLPHGDYWPGNILWRDGRLVAILDWEDAHVGDPVADLARSRLDMLWAYGADAMQSFTRYYRSSSTIDLTDLPYWDLCAALRPAFKFSKWATDDIDERRMREGHSVFVAQAYEALAAR